MTHSTTEPIVVDTRNVLGRLHAVTPAESLGEAAGDR